MRPLSKTLVGMSVPRPIDEVQPAWALAASRRRNRELMRDLAAAHALILELRVQLKESRGRAR